MLVVLTLPKMQGGAQINWPRIGGGTVNWPGIVLTVID